MGGHPHKGGTAEKTRGEGPTEETFCVVDVGLNKTLQLDFGSVV